MKRCLLALASSLPLLWACTDGSNAVAPLDPVEDPLDWVDPMIGAGGYGYSYGSAFVGATAPHGLVKLGPDTRGLAFGTLPFQHYSGYFAEDEFVEAFTHMHLHGTGLADYGLIGVMPTARFDPTKTRAKDYSARFEKDSEVATPGSYTVVLGEDEILAELTASVHTGFHRYTFPTASEPTIVLDLARTLYQGEVTESSMVLDAETQTIRGQLHSDGQMTGGFGGHDVFFAAHVTRPWLTHWAWQDGPAQAELANPQGAVVGAALRFEPGAPIELQIGISLVSLDGAVANLQAETNDWEGIVSATRAQWREKLSHILVEGGDAETRFSFYSALYHCFMMPTITSDVDGSYIFGGQEGKMPIGNFVSDLSLWDTYRTLHPLYHLIAPESGADAVRSLEAMAESGRGYPRWPIATGESGTMLGASADVVLTDAILKLPAIEGFDADVAFARLYAAATDPELDESSRGGRNPSADYLEVGYVPASVRRSVSTQLEYAIDDHALAQLARALGREAEAQEMLARSTSYRSLFDPATQTFRPRTADGAFPLASGYDPLDFGDEFAEANGLQMLWAPIHDLAGLSELLGGPELLIERLQLFFTEAEAELERNPLAELASNTVPRPYYWHGNEPDIHAAYLFAQFGRDDLSQRWLHWIRTSLYSSAPSGLPGNDDGGTMSSWYVFSAMGFYPVAGTTKYFVGMPLFPKLKVATAIGSLTITAEALRTLDGAQGVASVTLNGEKLPRAEFAHERLEGDATIEFEVVRNPTAWSE